jgi:hypothetical protein
MPGDLQILAGVFAKRYFTVYRKPSDAMMQQIRPATPHFSSSAVSRVSIG